VHTRAYFAAAALHGFCTRKKLLLDYGRVERSEIDAVVAKRVVLDTIESLVSGFANTNILRADLRRLFRWLKSKGVSTVITAETGVGKLGGC